MQEINMWTRSTPDSVFFCFCHKIVVNIYYCNINPRIIGHTSSLTDHCVFSWIMDILVMFKYKINDAKFD